MNSVTSLHRQAMELADQAFVARLRGEEEKAIELSKKAFEYEKQAAEQLTASLTNEPSRSILLRSAATIALEIGEYREAERLACLGLSGNPPPDIANELRDIYEQTNFSRHLELRGVTLEPDEFQMSIAGDAVGHGIIQTDEFVERVSYVEKLVYRTVERKLKKPYRDAGRLSEEFKDNFGLFTSTPRAASFAVTFKLGSKQELLSDETGASSIVDELFACLRLFNERNDTQLRKEIADEAYYRNFVSLAKQIAPDGRNVRLVGLTAIRESGQKQVVISRPKGDVTSVPIVEESRDGKGAIKEYKEITGIFRYAHGRQDESGTIRIISDTGRPETIKVPQGLSDVVRSLWDFRVTVKAKIKGKQLILIDIDKAE